MQEFYSIRKVNMKNSEEKGVIEIQVLGVAIYERQVSVTEPRYRVFKLLAF